MTSFVGAEYIIAAMLIQKIKLGQNTLSFDELSRYGINLQKKANTRNIDVIFLTAKDQINNAIHNYLDYFNCSYDAYNQVKNIMLDNSKDISNLEYHFIAYLPETILGLLICNQKEDNNDKA